ncbi:MAG: Hsp20 family protein [Methylomonas sp.]|nr:Hsp20 family protein [Methylomonas sp.]PPD20952.1 MAG: heat-shock protein Hsp20 [Methylomonas sp.]PPD27198.1 MAG: heat-shock protein Hsp20 [Methylomonas sp.]PPD39148.1 MAG: heat-shock protein Hsp20 [Methylomonas sp.]PPD41307.1 MAG: heat-shock protein Hsp20 [Methylomonas sp.]
MSNLSPFGGRSLFDELFRDVNPGYYVKPLHGDALPSQIKVDIKENPSEFIIQAEIPGTGKDNIHISIDGGLVSISAVVSQMDSERKDDKLLRSERYYGEVSRSFQLPVDVDQSASKAKYENGVLVLNLVKKQKQSSQRMQID